VACIQIEAAMFGKLQIENCKLRIANRSRPEINASFQFSIFNFQFAIPVHGPRGFGWFPRSPSRKKTAAATRSFAIQMQAVAARSAHSGSLAPGVSVARTTRSVRTRVPTQSVVTRHASPCLPLSLSPCLRRMPFRLATTLAALFALAGTAGAQAPNVRYGEVVPRDVREMYDRGLQYMASTQTEAGNWAGGQGSGPGGTGLGLMVFLASGEDPNFGLYGHHIRRALRSIITAQNASTGFLGQSMYHHG